MWEMEVEEIEMWEIDWEKKSVEQTVNLDCICDGSKTDISLARNI